MGSDDGLSSSMDDDRSYYGMPPNLKIEPPSDSPTDDPGTFNQSQSPNTPLEIHSDTVGSVKRPRGRPRKHANIPISPKPKEAHGRSKTGCLTCRKRKKKCDERKPECKNCEKNNVTCEGYPEKTAWKSGKLVKTRINEMNRRLSIPPLPPRPAHVFPGLNLESDIDLMFFEHFYLKMSMVLTLREDESSNPFIQLIIPMAANHKGLMHSLLALSGSHLYRFDPREEFLIRKREHFDSAITSLSQEVGIARERNADVEDSIVACMILQCLIPISEGSTDGRHRVHLDAARKYIKFRPNERFGRFAWEFYKYHDMSNTMTSLPRSDFMLGDAEDYGTMPTFTVPNIIDAGDGVMIGVLDGLFRYITTITSIRNNVRSRKQAGLEPAVEYQSIIEASLVGKQLMEWNSGQEVDTPKYVAAELYREAILVYLHRSIRASRPDPELSDRVDSGIIYLSALPPGNSTQCILLLPTFILGCAAFRPEQRVRIEEAFDRLNDYSRLGNIAPTRVIVHRVWALMDAGDEGSWDWETIMKRMNYDFLIT